MTIRVGNAPVSFGIFEPGFGETKQLPYGRVLDMIAEAGYEGTELGPYGYLPTDPQQLACELERRGLRLASSFVPLNLADLDSIEVSQRELLTVGRLLASRGVSEVIVADEGDERRAAEAGLAPAGWNQLQWAQVARSFELLGRALHAELGMSIVVHHHAGTYLETPAEIEHLLRSTDPEHVNLLLDTGHYVYGGGDPVALLRERRDRVRYLHYKDIDEHRLQEVRREKIDVRSAWRRNVFVSLGQGCVDFPALTDLLRESGYDGWVIVEQDVVPDEGGRIEPDPLACARTSREYLRGLGL